MIRTCRNYSRAETRIQVEYHTRVWMSHGWRMKDDGWRMMDDGCFDPRPVWLRYKRAGGLVYATRRSLFVRPLSRPRVWRFAFCILHLHFEALDFCLSHANPSWLVKWIPFSEFCRFGENRVTTSQTLPTAFHRWLRASQHDAKVNRPLNASFSIYVLLSRRNRSQTV